MLEETQIRASVEKVCKVPDKYRDFSVDTSDAERRFAIKAPLLAALLDFGLPHTTNEGQLSFNDYDLLNIGLDLRLPNLHWRFMRLWPRFLSAARKRQDPVYNFTLHFACPEPGHAGSCDFKFNPKFEDKVKAERVSPQTFQFQQRPISEMFDFGDSIEPIIAEACRLKFHVLPGEISSDMKFVRDSGLANCQAASLWLTGVGARYGISVRPATGFFISIPYSVRHAWLEIRVGNEWKHADPFFLNVLAQWGLVQPSDWPLSCSPRSAVLHLASDTLLDEPLIFHRLGWARAGAIVTSLVSSAAAEGSAASRGENGAADLAGPGPQHS
jgi:hypothetical protein